VEVPRRADTPVRAETPVNDEPLDPTAAEATVPDRTAAARGLAEESLEIDAANAGVALLTPGGSIPHRSQKPCSMVPPQPGCRHLTGFIMSLPITTTAIHIP
jgi:hypothetical protein